MTSPLASPSPTPRPQSATAEDLDAVAPGPYRSFVICVTGRAFMGAEDFTTACNVEFLDWARERAEQGHTKEETAFAAAVMEVKALDLARCRNAMAHSGRFGDDPPMEAVTELCLKTPPEDVAPKE